MGLGGLTLSFLDLPLESGEKNGAARTRLWERVCFPGRMAGVRTIRPQGCREAGGCSTGKWQGATLEGRHLA